MASGVRVRVRDEGVVDSGRATRGLTRSGRGGSGCTWLGLGLRLHLVRGSGWGCTWLGVRVRVRGYGWGLRQG